MDINDLESVDDQMRETLPENIEGDPTLVEAAEEVEI